MANEFAESSFVRVICTFCITNYVLNRIIKRHRKMFKKRENLIDVAKTVLFAFSAFRAPGQIKKVVLKLVAGGPCNYVVKIRSEDIYAD